METINVNMAAVEQNRKPISLLGSILGGKYYTLGVVETHPNFEKTKREIETNNLSDLITVRSPRRYVLRDHDVLSQALVTNAAGDTQVVFNPGTKEEAKATVIGGVTGFGPTTEEAVLGAMRGESAIFANGASLASKLNEYNQAEIDHIDALVNQLKKQRDAIKSTIDHNNRMVQKYEKEVLDSTPKVLNDGPGSVEINIVETVSE